MLYMYSIWQYIIEGISPWVVYTTTLSSYCSMLHLLISLPAMGTLHLDMRYCFVQCFVRQWEIQANSTDQTSRRVSRFEITLLFSAGVIGICPRNPRGMDQSMTLDTSLLLDSSIVIMLMIILQFGYVEYHPFSYHICFTTLYYDDYYYTLCAVFCFLSSSSAMILICTVFFEQLLPHSNVTGAVRVNDI